MKTTLAILGIVVAVAALITATSAASIAYADTRDHHDDNKKCGCDGQSNKQSNYNSQDGGYKAGRTQNQNVQVNQNANQNVGKQSAYAGSLAGENTAFNVGNANGNVIGVNQQGNNGGGSENTGIE